MNADYSKKEHSYRFTYVDTGTELEGVDLYHEWRTYKDEKVCEVIHFPITVLRHLAGPMLNKMQKRGEVVTNEKGIPLAYYDEAYEKQTLFEEIRVTEEGLAKAVAFWLDNGAPQSRGDLRRHYSDFKLEEGGARVVVTKV